MHIIDAFKVDRLPVDLVTRLLPDAIAWAGGEAVEPPAIEAVNLDEMLLKMMRELVEFRENEESMYEVFPARRGHGHKALGHQDDVLAAEGRVRQRLADDLL